MVLEREKQDSNDKGKKEYGVWDCSAQTGQTPTEARFYMLGVCWLYEGVLECIQNNFRVLFGFVFPFSFL